MHLEIKFQVKLSFLLCFYSVFVQCLRHLLLRGRVEKLHPQRKHHLLRL
jgi:hypothetical protein